MEHKHHFIPTFKNIYVVLFILILSSFLMGMRENPTNIRDVQIWKPYVVQEGITLWSIASDININEHPRKTLYDIRVYNHLETTNIAPGQVIYIPLEHL